VPQSNKTGSGSRRSRSQQPTQQHGDKATGNGNTAPNTGPYVYEDRDGKPLYRVVRTANKQFYQEHWDGNEWKRGRNSVPPVLYRLPAVIEAVRRRKVLWLPEGEKDVHALEDAGVVATTNPGGAGKWEDDFSRMLVGVRRVNVVWDDDAPGKEHALEVERSLHSYGVQIRLLRAKTGKDVFDHLAAGHRIAALVEERPGPELPEGQLPTGEAGASTHSAEGVPAVLQLAHLRLAEHAAQHGLPAPRPWSGDRVGWEACCAVPGHKHNDGNQSLSIGVGDKHPVTVICHSYEEHTYNRIAEALGITPREFSAARTAQHRNRLMRYGPAAMAEKPKPLVPLIEGVAIAGSFGPFGGREKTLKSYLACGFAIALAAGKPAFGFARWHVRDARPALVCSGEGGIDLSRRRCQRIARDLYGIDDISAIPLYFIEGVADMLGDEFAVAVQASRDAIAGDGHGDVALLVLDSLYNYHPEKVEVSNLYARGQMLSAWQHAMHDLLGQQCTLWVVDHFRKSSRGTTLEEYQQAGMGAWADSWFNIEHRQTEDLENNAYWLNVTVGSRLGLAGL
jgi:AAA domain